MIFGLLLAAVVGPGALAADDAWVLTTSDFRSERATLRGIDEEGLHVTAADGKPRLVDFDQFLQIERVDRPTPVVEKFILTLRGGEQVAGEPQGLEGETLVWRSASLGEYRVPLSLVRAMDRPAQLGTAVTNGRETEDVITLVNGDTVRGIVAAIDENAITVQAAGGDPVEVPLKSVATMRFAVIAVPQDGNAAAATSRGRAFRVSLADSTVVSGTAVSLKGGKLEMTLGDVSTREVPLASVVGVEQVNGPVVWLSSAPPMEDVHTPYLEYAAPARMNQSVTGGPIRFDNRTYTRGIGVHAYTRLTWLIDPAYKAFRTQYAIDGQLPYANVTVRILLDERVVHEVEDFTAGVLSPVVLLDTNGAKAITLEVDMGKTYDVQDRFNWIEPALLKEKPRPPPPPAAPPATSPASRPVMQPATQPGM